MLFRSCHGVGGLNAATLTGDPADTGAKIDALRGDHLPQLDAPTLIRRAAGEDLAATMTTLRCYRPFAAPPKVRVIGAEHVTNALANGKGVILWVGLFVHGSFVAKVGMHQAGFAVGHLSHPRHGFSDTRFGMAILNKARTVAEDRFLGARIKMGLDSATAALRTLREWLDEIGRAHV